MKSLSAYFVLIATILLFSSAAYGQEIRVDDETVAFLYESRAEIRTPDHNLAEIMSTDYRNARDEFTRYDLMQQIAPVIERRISEAEETTLVTVLVGGQLEDYNFEQNAFPTGFSEDSFIPYDNSYAVVFINGSDLEMLPVPLESARTIAGELRRSRRAQFNLIGEIVGTREDTLNFVDRKVLEIRITQLDVSLNSGTEVGVKEL